MADKRRDEELPPLASTEEGYSVVVQQLNNDLLLTLGKREVVTYKPGCAETIRVVDDRTS